MKNHLFIPRRFLEILFLIVPTVFAPSQTIRAQGVPTSPQILKLDSSIFPEIRLQVRLSDQKGYGVSGVSAGSLSIMEDNRPVEFRMEEREAGAEIAFVLDAGMGLYANGATGASRLEEMKQTVLELVEDPLLMNGRDAFHVLVQEPDGCQILVNPETPVTQIRSILAQYRPQNPDRLAIPLESIGIVLDQFEKRNASGDGKSQAIVLLSGSLQTGRGPSLSETAARAKGMGVPVHTILVREGFELGESMQALSRQSGGAFYFFDATGAASLSDLRIRLIAIRRQYFLAYRSPFSGTGTRVVSVGMVSGGIGKPALAQYSVTVDPPKVKILSPADNQTVSLQTIPTPEGLDPPATPAAVPSPLAGIVVTGSLSWPDGHTRRINQAVLMVNGKPQMTLDSPGEALTFVWNPSPDTGSSSGSARLQIQVEDELGLTAVSDPVNVRISSGWLSSICPPGSPSILCRLQITDLLSYFTLAIALTALALVIFFRKQVAVTAQKAAGTASEFIQDVGETVRFRTHRGKGKAQLIDVDGGSGWAHSTIDISGTTTIGRSKKNAALVLHAAREDSPISRLHCTITEEDGGFFLRDEQSANGTYLNGMRLVPLDNNSLKDGDEIRLGSADRGGIRLLFRFTQKENRTEETGMDATRWVSRD